MNEQEQQDAGIEDNRQDGMPAVYATIFAGGALLALLMAVAVWLAK